jgi:proline iminopeptidase
MSEESEEYIVSKDARIWTVVRGNGVPVFLCNGGPGSADYLGPVADMIDDLARIIRFEQRGCGRSEPKPPYNLETCLLDMENIRKHYQIQKWIVGGHSWGANLALAYALAHRQNVLGLIYLAGNGIQHDVEWRSAYHKGRAEKGEKLPVDTPPGNEEVNRQGNASWYNYIKKPELLRRISELRIPSLFIHGRFDIRPGWPAELIANLMPDASFKNIDAEHYLWLSQPDDLKHSLRRFIMDLKPDSR